MLERLANGRSSTLGLIQSHAVAKYQSLGLIKELNRSDFQLSEPEKQSCTTCS